MIQQSRQAKEEKKAEKDCTSKKDTFGRTEVVHKQFEKRKKEGKLMQHTARSDGRSIGILYVCYL